MSTNKTLQHQLMLTGLSSTNPFQTTLFGGQFLLIGVDATERIVYRHPLTKEATVSGQSLTNPVIPVLDYDSKGHPRSSHNKPAASDYTGSRYFHLVSDGLGKVLSLNGETHAVVGWYLIGVDGNDAVDVAPYAGTPPAGEQGNGRYGIGALLNDTARADMTTTGRMWLRWSCDAIQVSASTALPFLFTRQDDGSLRLVRTLWDKNGQWDSLAKESLLTEAGSTAALSLDLNQLFDADPEKSDIRNVMDAYGAQMVQRAMELDGAAGIDSQHPVSPLVELPTVYEDLLPPRDPSKLLDGFVTDSTHTLLRGTNFDTQNVYTGSVWHEEGFLWPSGGQGVRITVSMRIVDFSSSYTCDHYANIFKLAKLSSGFYSQPAVISLTGVFYTSSSSMQHRIATYDGAQGWHTNQYFNTKRDKNTALEFDSLYYQKYEFYLYPDHKAHVYCDGRYVGYFVVPDFLINPGERYTVGATGKRGRTYFGALHAESFDVPASHVPVTLPPMITGVDVSGTSYANHDPANLLDSDTSTNSGMLRFQATSSGLDHIEFNVTSAGKLSVFVLPDHRCVWELRRLTPTGSAEPFDPSNPLDPINLASFMTGEMPVNDWYTFPFVLPSGRYQLHAAELVENPSFTYLRRWRVDAVDSDTPMLVDTWPLGATFEGGDIASTLNSEQLEFEAGVNGAHLTNYNSSFSFTLTHDAKLRIHPHTNAGRVRLHRTDGKTLSLETGQLVSGQWYEFPYRIPAGKYQLSGIGAVGTTLTAWEAQAPGGLPEAPLTPVVPEFLDIKANTAYTTGDLAVAALTDGLTHDTSSSAMVGVHYQNAIEFDVVEEALLSVHTTGQDGNYARVRVARLNGGNVQHVVSSPTMRKRNWYTFPRPLEPGRYKLYGMYSGSLYAQITEWHLKPTSQFAEPAAPVVYDIDGKDTSWVESATNAHVVLSDGDASGWGGEHGVLLDNDGGVDYLRFRISKPADLLITPASDPYTGPVTLRRVNPTGSVTDVAILSLGKAGEASRSGYRIEPGKYMIYGRGSANVGNVAINQLAVEDGQGLPGLPAKARATVTASVNTNRDTATVEAALNDLLTPGGSQTTNSNSIPLKMDAYIEFTLDNDAIMNLFAVTTHRAALYRMIGEGDSIREEAFYAYLTDVHNWVATPFNLTAGTYRLYGGAPTSGWGPVLTEWAFSLPKPDYSTTPPPSVMEVDASGVSNFTGDTNWQLVDGSTYYDPATPTEHCVILKAAELAADGTVSTPAQNVVSFTLTQPADLSLFSAGGANDPVQLLSEDGIAVDLTTAVLVNEGWNSFGQTIPAGRYQLLGEGTTIITEIKAETPVPVV